MKTVLKWLYPKVQCKGKRQNCPFPSLPERNKSAYFKSFCLTARRLTEHALRVWQLLFLEPREADGHVLHFLPIGHSRSQVSPWGEPYSHRTPQLSWLLPEGQASDLLPLRANEDGTNNPTLIQQTKKWFLMRIEAHLLPLPMTAKTPSPDWGNRWKWLFPKFSQERAYLHNSPYIYIYTHTHTHVCIYICVYIYIERELVYFVVQYKLKQHYKATILQ